MSENGKIDGCGIAVVLMILVVFTAIATWATLSYLGRGAANRRDQIKQLRREVQELRDNRKK